MVDKSAIRQRFETLFPYSTSGIGGVQSYLVAGGARENLVVDVSEEDA